MLAQAILREGTVYCDTCCLADSFFPSSPRSSSAPARPDRAPAPAPPARPHAVTAPARGALVRWLPTVLWAAVLLTATSWPNPHVPDVRSGDKVVHLALYAGLAVIFIVAGLVLLKRASAPVDATG